MPPGREILGWRSDQDEKERNWGTKGPVKKSRKAVTFGRCCAGSIMPVASSVS